MAASLTLTSLYPTGQLQQIPNRIVLSWVSASDGTVAISTDNAVDANGNAANVHGIYGTQATVEFVPGTGGSQPTNGYSVTLVNASGIDVLAGQGAGLSNTTATAVCPGVPLKDGTTTSTICRMLSGAHTLNVSGAGSGKSGSLVLIVR